MSGDRIRRQHRFSTVPEHLTRDPRVSDRAFRLWCRLDRFAGDSEVAFPSRETLAIELDASKPTIDRAVTELVEAGWLEKERRTQGAVNLYTLVIAPQKATEAAIDQAVKKRREAAQPRLAREAERRRERKRGASVKDPSEGGVITSEETPAGGGVITGEETGVITGEERGVITGVAEKEASLEGGITEGSSDAPLRGSSADDADDVLMPLPGAAAPPASKGKAEASPHHAQAHEIVDVWIKHIEARQGVPVPQRDKDRARLALVREYVTPALESGATDRNVKDALIACGRLWPAKPVWHDALVEARGGRPLQGSNRPGRRQGTVYRQPDQAAQQQGPAQPEPEVTDEYLARIFGPGSAAATA